MTEESFKVNVQIFFLCSPLSAPPCPSLCCDTQRASLPLSGVKGPMRTPRSYSGLSPLQHSSPMSGNPYPPQTDQQYTTHPGGQHRGGGASSNDLARQIQQHNDRVRVSDQHPHPLLLASTSSPQQSPGSKGSPHGRRVSEEYSAMGSQQPQSPSAPYIPSTHASAGRRAAAIPAPGPSSLDMFMNHDNSAAAGTFSHMGENHVER